MEIVLRIPDSFKPLVAPVEKLFGTLEQIRSSFSDGQSVDYAGVERVVATVLALIECTSHQVLLQDLDINAPAVMIKGEVYHRVGRWEGDYHSMAGTSRVMRTLYRRTAEQEAVDPVSLRAGVVGDGWLPQTARCIAHQLQEGTGRAAAANNEQLCRLPYSRSSLEKVAHQVGQLYTENTLAIEQNLIERYQIPPEAASVSASLDRVSVPMEETPEPEPSREFLASHAAAEYKPTIERNFRMAFCGTVTLHNREGKALHTIRYGCMPQGDAAGLCEGMASDVDELRKKRPDLKVALLADGGEDIWKLMDEFLNEETLGAPVVRLIDLWHNLEKVGAAAAALHKDPDRARTQLGRWRLLLLNDSEAAAKILAELTASGREEGRGASSRPVHEAMTYLANHLDQMDYASARRQGLPVGSGPVEATCKSLMEFRLKRSGARWKEATAEHIVKLRALALSDRWDAAMDLTLAPLRVEVRAA